MNLKNIPSTLSWRLKWFEQHLLQRSNILLESHEDVHSLFEQYHVNPDLVLLTNLGEEHIEQYGGLESYIDSATSVLTQVSPTPDKPGIIVLNRDDTYFDLALSKCSPHARLVTVSIHHPDADIRATELELSLDTVRFVCQTPVGEFPIEAQTSGEFGVYNTLSAIAASWAVGVSPAIIQKTVANFPKVPGRFDVLTQDGPTVVVDYGHTLPGLNQVIKEARRHLRQENRGGKLSVVFGCSETWEANKRRKMVKLLLDGADECLFTTNNWSTLPPEDMLKQAMMGYASSQDQSYSVEWERQKAIAKAIDAANPEDMVLVLGRGVQPLMAQGKRALYFDDVAVTRKLLKQRRLYNPLRPVENPIIKGLGSALSKRIHGILAKVHR
jgi:UDP-N-acetylmuramoyl-L-alanyl-D-glutamate--2,6-diaminopimelate ligase